MKYIKRVLILFLLFSLTTSLLMGCNTAPAVSTPDPVDTTITVTDHLQRSVELPSAAKRLIGTHNPSLNMIVVLDGDGSRFVGFGSKDMAYRLYDLVAPEINDVTEIGKGKNINIETIMTVKPDLIVLPVRFKDQIDQLKDIGVPSIALDVEKFDSIKDALIVVGKAIGQDERAAELVAFFNEMIAKATAVAEETTNKPTVLMLSGSSRTRVSTDSMLQNLMIETAGGVSVTAGFQSSELWADVNVEQIIAWNPEVVYLPAYADYTVEDILTDPQWKDVKAVQDKRVHQFPSKLEPWDYPVAASSLGLCWTVHNLHPDLYSFEDLMVDVDHFYQFVYGQVFTPEQLGLK